MRTGIEFFGISRPKAESSVRKEDSIKLDQEESWFTDWYFKTSNVIITFTNFRVSPQIFFYSLPMGPHMQKSGIWVF